jgi:tetratricopeptide (TPR) repeat protein
MLGLLQAGKDAQALTVARAANDLFPAEPRSGIDVGLLMIQTGGDLTAARELLTQALKRPGRFTEPAPADRAEAYLSLGRMSLAQGDIPSARTALSQALAALPSDAEILYSLAAADQKANDALACATHIEKAMQVRPDLAKRDDYLIAAWALSRTDKLADAQALLRRAITAMPNASGLHLGLGYAMAADGKPVDALLEYWYEFENGASDDPYAKEARLQFQDSLGRAQAFPMFASRILLLRDIVEDTGNNPKTVLDDLRALDEAGIKHPTLDLLRAETLHAAGDAATAEALLRKLLTDDPAFLPAYFDLALILRSSERTEEARRLVADAVKRNPAHWQLIGEVESTPASPR